MARLTRAEALRYADHALRQFAVAFLSGKNPDDTDFTLPVGLSTTDAANLQTIADAAESGDPVEVSQGAAGDEADRWLVAASGYTALVTASAMTRPGNSTAYASGDLVANSTTAGSVAPLQFTVARIAAGSGMIRRCRIRKSGTGVTNASFRLHLYSASPTPANGDNDAWSTDQAANYLGALDVTVDRAFTDGAAGNGVPVSGSEINFKLASGQVVYGLLEAKGAYTPGNAEVFTVSLEVIQN